MKIQVQLLKSVLFIAFSLFIFSGESYSQTKDSIPPAKKDSAKITVSGYADAYYAFYTDSLALGSYQKFPSVSPHSNSFGLNIAHLNLQYDGSRYRGVVALHFGDIVRSLWDGNVMEAHAGIRLSKKLWLDGGYFRSHIGAEGLLPKGNIASSHSICNFMEPYYESGVRLNYNPNDKLILDIYVLNGYNIHPDNNDKKSVGLFTKYTFNENFNVGYSNYTGNDAPNGDTINPLRIFNNVFVNYETKKIKIQFGGDYAIQTTDDPNDPASLMGGVASFRYQLKKKTGIYIRGEYFSDTQGFISGTYVNEDNKITGLSIWGITAGLEYKPADNAYIRLEGRQLNAEKIKLFYWDGQSTNIRNEITINMGVSF